MPFSKYLYNSVFPFDNSQLISYIFLISVDKNLALSHT